MIMRTDDLIHILLQDGPPETLSFGRRLALALLVGFAASAALFEAILGPRPDIAAALQTPRFLLKIIEALLLAATAALLTMRLSRPGSRTLAAQRAMLAAPILLACAVTAELLLVSPSNWTTSLIGTNSRVCLASIPFLSLPSLAASLYALGFGAPTRPRLAGAAAGFLASGLAASLYAIHCPDDSPLFVATWYSLAIAAVSLIGAALGQRLLRW
jgi:hypothetical protein